MAKQFSQEGICV